MKKRREKKRKEKRKEKKKKRMAFLVATTSLPAVYRPNGYARTTTAGTPHARAKMVSIGLNKRIIDPNPKRDGVTLNRFLSFPVQFIHVIAGSSSK